LPSILFGFQPRGLGGKTLPAFVNNPIRTGVTVNQAESCSWYTSYSDLFQQVPELYLGLLENPLAGRAWLRGGTPELDWRLDGLALNEQVVTRKVVIYFKDLKK
jgi:hypothetical protein